MITYLLESALCLLIFLIAYHFLLENEKLHRFNRYYLLGAILLSLSLPLLNVTTEVQLPLQEITLPIVTIGNADILPEQATILPIILWILYFIVVAILAFRFSYNLAGILQQTGKYPNVKNGQFTIVLAPESVVPHSFLNYIFISEKEYTDSAKPQLTAHEMAHVKQGHTVDILLVEILNIVFWFNPLFVLYKRAIQLNHEFLADETVVGSYNDIHTYQELLLSTAARKGGTTITSNLNFLITKKRLIMMTKKRNNQRAFTKAALVLPIICLLFLTISTEVTAQIKTTESLGVQPGDSIYSKVDVRPDFPGGMMAFYSYVAKNFKIPESATMDSRIITQFTIEKDGTLTNIKIVRGGDNKEVADEVIRMLTASPRWSPGRLNNQAVRVYYTLPIIMKPAPPVR